MAKQLSLFPENDEKPDIIGEIISGFAEKYKNESKLIQNVSDFADFMQKSTGTNGHTGHGEIRFCHFDRYGALYYLKNGGKIKLTWLEIAKQVKECI